MAIEIVGKDQSVVKRVTCGNCSSILQYNLCDVKRGCDTDYTGGKDYYNYVPCACCGKQVTVKGY